MHRILIFLLLAPSAWTQSYTLQDNIPPEIFAIDEDPARNIHDAVFVKWAMRVTDDQIHRYIMVRILSERGKSVLRTMVLGEKLTKLDGRVVDVSGNETRFEKKSDLMKILAVRVGKQKKSRVVLLPPGLTPNCVVEVAWTEKAEHGLPVGQMHTAYNVPESVFCMEKVFEVSTASLSQFKRQQISESRVEMATRLMWTPIQPPASLDTQVFNGFTTVRYTNIPPMEQQPFGNPMHDQQGAYVQLFRTIQYTGLETKQFWNSFSSVFVKAMYGDYYYKDGAYGYWLKEVLSALPAKNADGAKQLFYAFKRRFTRVDLMTHQQRDAMETATLEQHPFWTSDLLNELANKGYAFPPNLGLAFYRVLTDSGYKPKLIFAPSNPNLPFEPQALNPFLLDHQHPAVGIKDGEGRWHLFAPAHGEYDMGQLPDQFRGNPLLVVDPSNDWKASFLTLKPTHWKRNRILQAYTVKLDGDGSLRFSVSERNQGIFNAQLRSAYHYIDPNEQAELMRAQWQVHLPGWQLGSAAVEGVSNYRARIVRRLKGGKKLNLNKRSWLEIAPFPGSQPLVEIPAVWPHERTQPIVLPGNRGHISRSKLSLPPGWTIMGDPSWEKKNKIGKVSFSLKRSKGLWVVEREIIIEQSHLEASEDPLLRAFISWVSDAIHQKISVGKEGGS